MANEKLIKSMMACNGTNAACKTCSFKNMPDCRNAMAHHAGALIQLQDVVIANSAAQAGHLLMQKEAAEQAEKQATDLVRKQRAQITKIKETLARMKHCETCEYSKPHEVPDYEAMREAICAKCHGTEGAPGLTQWEMAAELYLTQCDICNGEGDDCEGCQHAEEHKEEKIKGLNLDEHGVLKPVEE